jgi:hypothetical protein
MSVSTQDLLNFWRDGIPNLHIHPADADALRSNDHQFDLRVGVGAWMGPISTAEVVLLYLNGGLSNPEQVIKASQDPETREEVVRTLQGSAPLFSFKTDPGGREWTTARLGQFGVTYDSGATKVAFVNLMPYKSRNGSEDTHMVPLLESSRLVRQWAQDTLFPEARRGDRVVVCMRSAALWALRTGGKEGVALYAPQVTRGGFMHHGPMREEIARAVRARVFGLPPSDKVAS